MITAVIAGFLNALGTYFLKFSNKSYIFLSLSVIFYFSNFYFFRISLKNLQPGYSYCILIMTSLITLKIFEVIKLRSQLGLNDLIGILLFSIAIYLFSK